MKIAFLVDDYFFLIADRVMRAIYSYTVHAESRQVLTSSVGINITDDADDNEIEMEMY